jgi:hypothetical protein
LAPTDYAITNKLTPFISMQNHYSLLYREEEREMFPMLKVRPLIPHRPSQFRIMTLSPSTLVLVPFRGHPLRAAPSPAHCLLGSPNALKRIGPSIRSLARLFFNLSNTQGCRPISTPVVLLEKKS